jgi:hypothetical protein
LQFNIALMRTDTPEIGAVYTADPSETAVAIIFETGGIGGRNAYAKAKIDVQSACDWCENWQPADPVKQCAEEIMKNEDGRVYQVSANCHSGELTSILEDRYVYDGLWKNSEHGIGWDEGWAKFKDAKAGEAFGTSRAAGGLSLAGQWRTLCPLGHHWTGSRSSLS